MSRTRRHPERSEGSRRRREDAPSRRAYRSLAALGMTAALGAPGAGWRADGTPDFGGPAPDGGGR